MRIQGPSMEPLLRDGQLVLIRDRAYHRCPPRRGEVVVARPGALYGRAVIKRIAGLPQERVTVAGRRWDLGEGEYFLLGSCLDDSLDSRAFGPVRSQELIGRLWVRLWPFTIFRAP